MNEGKGRKIGASCVCNITRKKEAKMSREGRVRSGLGKDGEAFWEVGRSLASPRLVWLGGRKSYIRFKGFFLVRGGGFGWWWLSVSSSSSSSLSSLGLSSTSSFLATSLCSLVRLLGTLGNDKRLLCAVTVTGLASVLGDKHSLG